MSLDKEENIISSNPIEMVFKPLGKYLNDLSEQIISNYRNELARSFRAEHKRI
jgi:hypothetical protein